MTLDNLIGKSLEKIEPDTTVILRLIKAAERNICDAAITELSNENRFDAAYKAIMQLANASLQASGFRTLTSQPGHHQTMIQSLSKTVGINSEELIVLDGLRKKRNVTDYSGEQVEQAAVEECISQAKKLLELTREWLRLTN